MNRERLALLLPQLRESDIQDIIPYELSAAIQGIEKPLSVVTCHCFRSRASYLHTAQEICVIHNTYITSMFYHSGLFQLAFEHNAESPELTGLNKDFLIKSLAKSFVAEQCFAIEDTHMARTLLLETKMAVEAQHRRLFELRNRSPDLEAASKLLAKIASDFSLHHELGHHAYYDERFMELISPGVDHFLSGLDGDVNRDHLRYECIPDIFALSCCIGRYASILTEQRLKQYLTFIVSLFGGINSLYLCAQDMHSENHDPTQSELERKKLEANITMLAHRQDNMNGYLEAFKFEQNSVTCIEDDNFLPLNGGQEITSLLTQTDFFVSPPSEDIRRIAELISESFEPGRDFQYYIDNSKIYQTLS